MIIAHAVNISAYEIIQRNRFFIGLILMLFGIVIIFAIRALTQRKQSE